VSVSIDPVQQVVTFSTPLWRTANNRFYPIEKPVLLTGCYVREADNNGLRCAYLAERLPGGIGSLVATRKHQDVRLNLIGRYDANGNATGATALEADAHERARYYLEGLKAQYFYSNASTRQYNGIVLIDADGAIAQVTWSIGPNGAETTASRNTEHSVYVPPYPARRRAEFLRPINMQAIEPPNRVPAARLAEGGNYQ
jgi:hypothetical protein